MVDTQTIQNILEGNIESEKILYNKYKSIIVSFIKKNYGNYNEIDDDVSEILIKIFLNLSKYDKNKSQFKSWVLTITKNYLIDKWREKTNNFEYQSITIDYDELNDYQYNYTQNIKEYDFKFNDYSNQNFENIYDIEQIKNQLTYIDYSLLEMKYIQGYNYNEIGERFNISSTTASNKVNYLKSKLKKKNYSYICNII